jgi:hypothetical protein
MNHMHQHTFFNCQYVRFVMSVGQDLPRDMYAEQALLVHSTCSILYIGVISVITTGDTTVFLLDLCVQFSFQFPANFCTGKGKKKGTRGGMQDQQK